MINMRTGFGAAGFLFFAALIGVYIWIIVLFGRGVAALQSIAGTLKEMAADLKAKGQ